MEDRVEEWQLRIEGVGMDMISTLRVYNEIDLLYNRELGVLKGCIKFPLRSGFRSCKSPDAMIILSLLYSSAR